MPLTVNTVAPTLRLTTVAAVQAELGISTDTSLLGSMVDAASAAIVSYCRRPFARESYTEELPGFGDIRLQLARTPIAAVTSLTLYGETVTDYGIEDADKGWLFMRVWNGTSSYDWPRSQFPWSPLNYIGLSGAGTWLDRGTPLARQEMPVAAVDYTAGYILPSQFMAPTTVSVDGTDDSFNDSASGFPSLLKAGDIIETSGFANAANNARFKILTATTAKITISGSLTTEAAPVAATSIKFRPPSSHRPFDDVEKACIEVVKTYYSSRKDDSDLVEKSAGPMRLRWSESGDHWGLPAAAVGLLRPWVRAA